MAAVPSLGRASEVEAAPRTNEDALAGELYARHSERIYRYCFNRLRSREEAEDATQTTFLNALRGLQRGVTPELEQAWLYKIAENVCLTRVRANVRRRRVESPTDLDPLHELIASPAGEADALRGIEDALARLPEQQRRAILLREWQGLSYREIADELGLSQGAVETLIFRARRSLARELERPEERGPLRKLTNVGSLLGWLKTVAFGGSTAVKVAAVVAAGSAVIAAGSDQALPKPRSKAPAATQAASRQFAPLAVAATRLRPPKIRMVASRRQPVSRPAVRPRAAKRVAEPAPAATPDRRSWRQHVPAEQEPSRPAVAVQPEATSSSAPAEPAKPTTEARPATKQPAPSQRAKAKPALPVHAKAPKLEPGPPPQAAENAPDDPSSNAPGQTRDKPKKG